MGQYEVLNFLKDQRAITDKWFCVNDIKKALKERGFSNGIIKGVNDDLLKLVIYNTIEWQGKGLWKHQKLFRAKLV